VRPELQPGLRAPLLVLCLCAASEPALASCAVWADALVLGGYDPSSPAAVVQGYEIEVRCDGGDLQFELSLGQSATSGTVDARAMRHAFHPDLLRYNLYQDASATRLWTDRGAGLVSGTTSRGRARVPVFARIEPLQDAWVGDYHDEVVLTVLP